ncbi:hypothetical protein niasHT_013855 [Heterodera trifolii]|uniref:Uncharacterized protein n=1 Tax=Heterodera trifolii TaxID=157864 RepID=A0ABD2LF10_9BILA
MLTTLEELKAIPCGTQLACFCEQIVSILPTEKKLTALMTCASGENVAVTAFKNVSSNFSSICSLGKVVKMSMLKAQRFIVERFDGSSFYNSPLAYEFVVMKHTKIEVVQCAPKIVDSFGKLSSGSIYSMNCALASSFSPIGKHFAAVVADKEGMRADLYVNGEALVERLGSFDKDMQINLDRFFVKVEDECLQLHCESSSVKMGAGRVNLGAILTTPIKRRSSDESNSVKKVQKNG